MTAAEDAHAAAEARVEKALAEGATELDFDSAAFRALESLPPRLAALAALRSLNLRNTQVADLAPLQGLSALEVLTLTGTQVSDVASLQGLGRLRRLDLGETPIADLTPLKSVTYLKGLDISGTEVTDLRPLLDLPDLGEPIRGLSLDFYGLRYAGSAATRASPRLRALSEIEDDMRRTQETLDYLRSLPPWPEPLPFEDGQDSEDGNQDGAPPTPGRRAAPLEVIFDVDILRPATPGDGLADLEHDRARQGYAALCDYLADLADQRPRIGNALPRLAKALDALERALGEDYVAMNPIAVGTQGTRVIRLNQGADSVLMDDDAADLAEFAAALALFLERFPEWIAYKEDAARQPPSPEAVSASLPAISELTADLAGRPEIDPGVTRSLDDQIDAVRDDPNDGLTTHGLNASTSNVLNALAEMALLAWRRVKAEVGDISLQAWKVTKGALAAGLSSLALASLDVFFNKGKLLQVLAEAQPTLLGWLQPVLQSFGL